MGRPRLAPVRGFRMFALVFAFALTCMSTVPAMAGAVTPAWINPTGDQGVEVSVFGYNMTVGHYEIYRSEGRPSASQVSTTDAGLLIGQFAPGSGSHVDFNDAAPARDSLYTYWVFGFAPDGGVEECTPYLIRTSCTGWGRVTYPSGAPVAGSTVTLWILTGSSLSSWESVETTLTDSDGNYGLVKANTLRAQYTQIAASDPVHGGPSTFVGGGFYPEDAPRLVSIPHNANITLDNEYSTISGRVTSLLDGSAIESATVGFADPLEWGQPTGFVKTGANGAFCAYVKPGRYCVNPGRFDYIAKSFFITVTADSDHDCGTIALEPAWDYKPPVTTDTYDGGWVRPGVVFPLNWTHVYGPYYQSVPTSTTVQIGLGAPFVYSGPIVWSTPGETTMQYSSLSSNNVQETTHTITLRIDGDAPVTVAATLSAGPATDVNLAAADAISGVQATWLEVDGVAQAYTAPVTISAVGSHMVRYWSEDKAGNWEVPQNLQVDNAGTMPAPHGDPLLSAQWWFERMQVPQAWAAKPATNTVVVAVVAGGFDMSNSDLANSFWTNPGEILGNGLDDDSNGVIDDVHGAHFSDTTTDTDLVGWGPAETFGTMLAGVIASGRDNGVGIRGIAPNAKIMAVRCDDYGAADFSGEQASGLTLGRCISYAADNGAKVIVVDPSDPSDAQDAVLTAAIKHAADRGALILSTGMGGGGPFVSWPTSSDATNVITVGPSNPQGGRGDIGWGAQMPLFAAPAYGVVGPSQVLSAGIMIHHGPGRVLKLGFEPQFIQNAADRTRTMVAAAQMITPEKYRPVVVIGPGGNQWVQALTDSGWQHVSVSGATVFSAFKGSTVIWAGDESYGWALEIPSFLDAGGRLLTSGGRGSMWFDGWGPGHPLGAYQDPAHALYVQVASGAPAAGTTSTLPGATVNSRRNLYEVVTPDTPDAKTVFEYTDVSQMVNLAFSAGTAGGVAAYVWGVNPQFTAADVRARLASASRPSAAFSGFTVTGGELNMLDAVVGPTARTITTRTAVKVTVPGSVRRGHTFKMNGSMSPLSAAGTVAITRSRLSGGHWRAVGTAHVRLRGGRFSYSFRPSKRGKWRISVTFGGSTAGVTKYLPSKSGIKNFVVK
jgi:hypothetical protein